ncbi:MAG: PEP-CTERM sorting domain-containing protein [Planctomycetota bacterium]|nr:PEP-CTERM sorting domain-containing protein [Planctomycetota bacterium]
MPILHSDLTNRQDDLDALTNLLKAGRLYTSSTAPYTGLAIALNDTGTPGNPVPLYTKFGGQPVTSNSMLVKYTWNGDTNLDGLINADDYFMVDSGFITQAKGYQNGDLTLDGVVNANDYFLIDSAFIGQSGVLVGGAMRTATVPEPAGLAVVALGMMCLAVRRRRRNGNAA